MIALVLLYALLVASQTPMAFTIDLVDYSTGSTVLCLGDSLTHGLHVSPDDESGRSSHPYTIQLTKSLSQSLSLSLKSPANVIEEGVNGATLKEMLARLPDLMKKYDPLIVVILGGTNDLGMGHANATHMLSTLAQLHKVALTHLRSDKKKVVTLGVTIPPVDGHDEEQDITRNKVVQFNEYIFV
jgi:lysophospholipase L1-like esterase